ncbi:hypothetical protein F5883DRAFT_573230 [Diaporthe sp. PMI_573]|nr:hypothetical protein F5883DRAFT_573230 [Diaporthaceae sp. PMI_573]
MSDGEKTQPSGSSSAVETDSERPVDELETQFKTLNDDAARELSAEKARIIAKFQQAKSANRHIDGLSPDMLMEVTRSMRQPSPSVRGINVGQFTGMIPKAPQAKTAAQRALWGMVMGAAFELACGLNEVLAAPPEQRLAAWTMLAARVCKAAVAAGATSYLAQKLQRFLVVHVKRILALFASPESAEKLAFKLVGNSLEASALGGALVASAFLAITSLWHTSKSVWAKYNGDLETSNIEWQRSIEALSVDNLVRTFVTTISGVVIATGVAPLAGTGAMGFLVPCAVYLLAQWLIEEAITRKNHYGGWSLWFSSWIMEYRGPKVWKGGNFEAFENQVTEELMCSIGHTIVVDPVRSIRTGQIYERALIYQWIDKEGTDPWTRDRCTRLSFVDSDLAKARAERIASFLGASAVPAPSEDSL